ncbi:hypothetical protein [Gordonia neofelifaecis]|uniref:AbiEi antitoxin C-terminal domain-containing protein n=1 Tax=Gordonia neofelifaecis NRRL B-59395 TaxID=644548 RepID=F1YM04_9ACTN|nr:hypothetical protein [Gordonia neofelifaecis]EGD54255.1 hypothetical protein SCNU_14741 [Gordonia neofelifaecis NRRL B-59395]
MGDSTELDRIIRAQSGVISRRQALACGADSADIRRRKRRRDWIAVYDGIYITHNGPMTWLQHAWCAILYAGPAALSHTSALRAVTGDGNERGPIHVAVDAHRNLSGVPGVVVHYRSDLESVMLSDVHPPRVRLEETVLDLASAGSTTEAIAILSDVVGGRWTTADRLLVALDRRRRLRLHAFLRDVLTDVRDGACSVLEHQYLNEVERRHGLPTPVRQAPTTVGRRGFRDIDYPEFGLVVELDGRLGHDDAVSRDRDLERDLDAAAHADRRTVRIGSGQVFGRPCSTAAKVGRILIAQGWETGPRPCRSPTCSVRA